MYAGERNRAEPDRYSSKQTKYSRELVAEIVEEGHLREDQGAESEEKRSYEDRLASDQVADVQRRED
ncbi:MAG: hypothetical protein V3U68_07405 [Bacteroidota bacterium]